jgi:phosphatidate cytidylyltransferase
MLGGFGFMVWNVHEKLQPFGVPISEIGKWIVTIIAVILPVKEIVFSKKNNAKVVAISFFGLAYISLSWGLMISLRNNGMMFKGQTLFIDLGMTIPIVLIVSIWINDTMAYIVGSLIGKTPLTKISPKKTWEGTIGGALLAVIIVTTSCYFLISANFIFKAVTITTIAAIIGTCGDLFESKLKRLANVKDSGSFMPGHGGFLDRFDSLLLATPFVWLFLWLF